MSSSSSVDVGRFARTLTLIIFVTAVFIVISAIRLEGVVFQIGSVAIGTVGFITAIIGFLVSASQWYDDTA
jgi:hypothetical protein